MAGKAWEHFNAINENERERKKILFNVEIKHFYNILL